MGQYHLLVNLDKRQYVHPHQMGDGLKLMEFGMSGDGGVMTACALLLASACKGGQRGGGDIHADIEGTVGAWAGDRIAIVGDYGEPEDLPDGNGDLIYSACSDSDEAFASQVAWLRESERDDEADRLEALGRFQNISQIVKDILFLGEGIVYGGDGWQRRMSPWHEDREEYQAARDAYAEQLGTRPRPLNMATPEGVVTIE